MSDQAQQPGAPPPQQLLQTPQQLPAVPPPQSPSTSGSDSLQCQWTGCGERGTSAEQLYEHVCERHVGRKSTNNLNLTCQWGTCRTTTVKRDHITSHIRVHVPLKPHKCDFCGKSFKRPQDLKKHVKTHADDSVILRSPEPSGMSRHHPNAGFPMGSQHQPRPNTYYPENPLQTSVPVGYGYQNHNRNQGYYAPTQQPTSSAYGPVYYSVNNGGDVGSHASLESQRRTSSMLNDFFGDAKRGAFDPASYNDVGTRLMALQGVPLTMLSGDGMTDYQSAPAMVGVQGGVYGPTASLPSMPNLKTKNDLTAVGDILEQMTTTAYEYANSVGAARAAHSTPSYELHTIRSSHSPPSLQLPSSHMPSLSAVPTLSGSSTQSAHSPTPGLSPPSSSSSSHSPASNLDASPTTGTAMYPTLPSVASTTMFGEYAPSSMAPSSALGAQFDRDLRRRHGGGTLQKAQPASNNEDAMDVSSPGKEPSSPHGCESKFSTRNIDPALSRLASSPSLRSPLSETDDTLTSTPAETMEENWVNNMRLVEALRSFVKGRLERGEWEDEADGDSAIGEINVRAETAESASASAQPLYPVLREVDVR